MYILLANVKIIRFVSDSTDHTPCFDKTFKTPCGIGRAGGGEHDGFAQQRRVNITLIAVKGLFSVTEDRGDRRGVQDYGKVVRHDVANRAVRTPLDRAPADAVPERNMIAFQKSTLFGNGTGRLVVKNSCRHAPETVLRVPVKEHLLPGFDRGKAAEDEDMRIRPIKRGKGMCDFDALHRYSIADAKRIGKNGKNSSVISKIQG